MLRCTVETKYGRFTLSEENDVIVGLAWGQSGADSSPLLRRAGEQLRAYFNNGRHEFDLPLAPAGSPFQKAVWHQMRAIPAGETRSYGQLAAVLGSVARAVGSACGANPIPIVIPCHRVLAADGRIGGFSGRGGITTKRWLLAHEGAQPLQMELL